MYLCGIMFTYGNDSFLTTNQGAGRSNRSGCTILFSTNRFKASDFSRRRFGFYEATHSFAFCVISDILTLLQHHFRKSDVLALPKRACGVQFSTLCLLRTAATVLSEIQCCGDICSLRSMCGSVPVDRWVSPRHSGAE